LNKAVIDRLQEILDTNPTFARLDSVYQMLATVYTRDNQPEKALECWSIIVKNYPDSEHVTEAKKHLGSTVETDKKEQKKDGKADSKPE
jgi:outer membrane protein assembly factor BamD (BamD/ComL family)